MNAQAKPNEQAAADIRLQHRRNDAFEIDLAKAQEELLDELEGVLRQQLAAILSNYRAGDDMENGAILARYIGGFAIRVQRAREAKDLRDEFLPSWRSEVQP